MDPIKVGTAIRILRLCVGYTQKELSDCLNVTDKAVSKWERGLSLPDISIITRLCNLLNCDVDNLLEGNITYLEKNWQGVLWLTGNQEVFSWSELYGKPLVDLFLGYFLLAGIGDIFISCSKGDRRYIESRWGNGDILGVNLFFLPEGDMLPISEGNTMLVYNNPFVYGPYLTRCFQRAMSRENGISVLSIRKDGESEGIPISFDINRKIKLPEKAETIYSCVPIMFFPKRFFREIEKMESFRGMEHLYTEPLDNGMIEYLIKDRETVLDTAAFFRFMEKRMNRNIYDLRDIARSRHFIK